MYMLIYFSLQNKNDVHNFFNVTSQSSISSLNWGRCICTEDIPVIIGQQCIPFPTGTLDTFQGHLSLR